MTGRARATLDLGGFAPKSTPSQEPIDIAHEVGQEAGFTARHGDPSPTRRIDGRSLRRTGRTDNLNIGIEPAVRDEFWRLAAAGGFQAGGEFLKELLRLYRETRA